MEHPQALTIIACARSDRWTERMRIEDWSLGWPVVS